MMRTAIVIAVILAVLLVVFALQNNAAVTIKLLLWQIQSPLGLVLLLSFAAGAVMAVLLSLPGAWRRGRNHARQRRELEELRTQLADNERKLADAQKVIGSARDGESQNSTPAANILGMPPLV